jgi:hypothetical protein
MRVLKMIAAALLMVAITGTAYVCDLWWEMHRYSGGFSSLVSETSFDFNGATVTLERRAAKPFLAEYHRYVTIRDRDGMQAKTEITMDKGGSGRLDACETSGKTLVLRDPHLNMAYAVETTPKPGLRSLPGGGDRCTRFIGAFDGAARGGYRFVYHHS